MKISRGLAIRVRYILDEFMPPVLRDSKLFSKFYMKILFGKNDKIFMNFKQKNIKSSSQQINKYYDLLEKNKLAISRETDLNDGCISQILKDIKGKKILEVGCGRYYLLKKIINADKTREVIGSDIIVDKKSELNLIEADITDLPFKNKQFDTVVCTHTLEHIPEIFKAISELRRVAKKRLIVVVPKERPYATTPNLHVHFFPYIYSFMYLIGNKNGHCKEIDGDLYYKEDIK